MSRALDSSPWNSGGGVTRGLNLVAGSGDGVKRVGIWSLQMAMVLLVTWNGDYVMGVRI